MGGIPLERCICATIEELCQQKKERAMRYFEDFQVGERIELGLSLIHI